MEKDTKLLKTTKMFELVELKRFENDRQLLKVLKKMPLNKTKKKTLPKLPNWLKRDPNPNSNAILNRLNYELHRPPTTEISKRS